MSGRLKLGGLSFQRSTVGKTLPQMNRPFGAFAEHVRACPFQLLKPLKGSTKTQKRPCTYAERTPDNGATRDRNAGRHPIRFYELGPLDRPTFWGHYLAPAQVSVKWFSVKWPDHFMDLGPYEKYFKNLRVLSVACCRQGATPPQHTAC